MSITVTVARFQGKQREEIIQDVQKQMQERALQAIKQVLRACLEAEVTVKLGREKGEPRRVSSHAREIDWKCGQCGCQDAHQFTADERSSIGRSPPVRDHTQWEILLNRLWVRDVTAEQGLKMIVGDGCGGLGEAVALVYGNSILDQRSICAQTEEYR